VRDYQISAPDWLGSERFDIVAKLPRHTGDSETGARLQRLLADRFKLAVHRETKEFPVYALVQGRSGSKLKAVEDKDGHNTNSKNGRLTAQRISMARLAEFLSRQMERPVVDMTGLTGVYDLTLEWSPDDGMKGDKPAGDVPPGPDLLTALQQQLGLTLRSQKAPLEMIVVDHVERVPSEN
jgi:uncharacterized protein (TIGR03435 family)